MRDGAGGALAMAIRCLGYVLGESLGPSGHPRVLRVFDELQGTRLDGPVLLVDEARLHLFRISIPKQPSRHTNGMMLKVHIRLSSPRTPLRATPSRDAILLLNQRERN